MTPKNETAPFETPLCPTGCGRKLPHDKVVCGVCWRRVPKDLGEEVYRAWRAVQRDLTNENVRRHRDAKIAVIQAATRPGSALNPDDPDAGREDLGAEAGE
jgi:hypothetical protein